jgi:hypothetical protein
MGVRPDICGRVILKMVFMKQDVTMRTEFICITIGFSGGYHEDGNKPSVP